MHETAEQAVVRPAMDNIDGSEAADRIDEESEGERVLKQLQGMTVESPEFDAVFAKFRTAVLTHASREEDEEHPRLRDHVDPSRLADMAVEFDAVEDEVNAG